MGFSNQRIVGLLAAYAFAVLGVACKSKDETQPASTTASASSGLSSSGWRVTRDSPVSVGDIAPDFEAIAHTGARVKLSDFLSKPVVVYFYPKDNTSGCTAEAQSIRDEWLNLNDKLSMVFGVSADSNVSHRDFATEHNLPFLLLADTDHAIANAFGVPVQGGRAQRITFLIGTDGKVVRVWDSVDTERHGKEIREALAEAKP